jgi:hypothetical protein
MLADKVSVLGTRTVQTLMRRMASNTADQAIDVTNSECRIIVIVQVTTSSLSKHSVTALLHESRIVKVKTTENIQYTVDNANTRVRRVRSHFRARLWSPLVLSHKDFVR